MLKDILEEHLDDAAWLFERRQALAASSGVEQGELAEIDRRLRAHLDGFVLGGATSWELCRELLTTGTTGQAFVATLTALEGRDEGPREEIEATLANAIGTTYEGIWRACGFTSWADIIPFLMRQLERTESIARAVAIEALTERRIDPGSVLEDALHTSESQLAIAALAGVRRLGYPRYIVEVESRVADEDARVSGAALESLASLDPGRCRLRCRELLGTDGAIACSAAKLLASVGNEEDVPSLAEATRSRDLEVARESVLSLGKVGDLGAVPSLIDALDVPALTEIAAFALRSVLGRECPRGMELPPPLLEEEGPDRVQDGLPGISAEKIRKWWAECRQSVGR